jgi:glycine cleavage system P protein (glycine dehydrogenase) subunit 1
MHAPHTDRDVKAMLDVIGVKSLEELSAPPAGLEIDAKLEVDAALPEAEAYAHIRNLAEANTGSRMVSFLGAGAYRHYQPPAVPYLATRSEFITAYTPYQAEASQGSLQAIFEWQTYICLLTGLDVSNASVYDGSTALAEGVIMACQATGRKRVIASTALHPGYRAVLNTYAEGMGVEVVDAIPRADGTTEYPSVDGAAAVIVQSPNFFGCIEDVAGAAAAAKAAGALTIQVVAEAISLGALKTPGESGADIAVGEAQSFGLPVGYGGPYVGFVATTKEHVRRLPGRLVGETHDVDGRKAFVLTLQGREQHIRRELASSNICTNQALCALFATIYLATVGAHGLRSIAVANMARARDLRSAVLKIAGFRAPLEAPFFNEFVVDSPLRGDELVRRMASKGFLAGVALASWFGDMPNSVLLCATELTSKDDVARFAAALAKETADAVVAV